MLCVGYRSVINLILNVCVANYALNSLFLQRNYRFFFMFVSSTTLLCIYVFAFCWVNLKRIMDMHECKIGRALLKSPISGLLILYTFIAVWFVGGLTSFHLYLISTNQVSLFLSNWSNSQSALHFMSIDQAKLAYWNLMKKKLFADYLWELPIPLWPENKSLQPWSDPEFHRHLIFKDPQLRKQFQSKS